MINQESTRYRRNQSIQFILTGGDALIRWPLTRGVLSALGHKQPAAIESTGRQLSDGKADNSPAREQTFKTSKNGGKADLVTFFKLSVYKFFNFVYLSNRFRELHENIRLNPTFLKQYI